MLRRWIAPATLLILTTPAWPAVNKVWEMVIPNAIENAFVVLDATGNPRIVSNNNSGLLSYAALDRDGNILASGVFPAGADVNRRFPSAGAAAADGGATACGVTVAPAIIPGVSGRVSNGLAVRFSVSGSTLWSKVLGDAELGLCGINFLQGCTTTSGALFGVGRAVPPTPFPGSPPSCAFIPANFNSFLVRLDETSGAVTGLRTFPLVTDGTLYIAMASSGAAVYALGSRGRNMILDRYDTDLNLVWTATAATSGLMPISVAVSSQGVVAALGQRGTLDARVLRFAPDGSALGEAIVPFPESSGVAITGGSTSYVSGRRSPGQAALASASSADAVTVEFEDPAAKRYLSVAVDATNGIFTSVERIGDIRVARFAPVASTATSRLSIHSGNEQIGEVNAPLSFQLEVRVLDASSAPALGVPVIFSVSSPTPKIGASVTPTTTQSTFPNGIASTIFQVGGLPIEYQVTCNCPTCGPAGSSATFTACGKLGTNEFRQNDITWSTTTLGNHAPNNPIGRVGCALSSVANLINFYNAASSSAVRTDPLQLNADMIAQRGYNNNDDIRWGAVANFTQAQIASAGDREIEPGTTRADLITDIDADVAQGRPVIIPGEHPPAGSGRYHFMLVVGRCGGQYVIADPISPTGNRLYDPNEFDLPLRGIHRYEPQ